MTNAIRRYQKTGNGLRERLIIKTFPYRDDMHRFLAEGDNALVWHEISKLKQTFPDKAGTYVFAGGEWRDVKKLDSLTLAHC